MKKLTLLLVAALAATAAYAATGYWTGRSEQIWTVSNKPATKCWYDVHGSTYTVILPMKEKDQYHPQCPTTMEFE